MLGVGGCGSSSSDTPPPAPSTIDICQSVCDKGQAATCDQADMSNFDHGKCVGGCTNIGDMKKDTDDCYAEASDMVNCVNKLSDICLAFELDTTTAKRKACSDEFDTYRSCVMGYCTDHSGADYCNLKF